MFFKDKKILIIGGTGTIGKSLLQHILKDQPKVVRIFSRDEYKQFMLENEIGPRKDIRFLIGDVRDYDRVLHAMDGIDYVFHTAAMKHVPACEYNPYEAVLTNIIGTNHVIKAAVAQNVKKVVFTSSDKAISPTNAYGATKLTAERLISAAQYSKGRAETVFSCVRFGNVMGSRGSVVPLFTEQILKQKKVTVTDLNMNRFMMTLDQATSLLISALKESQGGEIFILKMPVISLRDLVSVVVEETCKNHNLNVDEIEIQEIGLRPGEKMYEELMTHDESTMAFELPEMFVIPSAFGEKNHYTQAKKATEGTYSSNDQEQMSKGEVLTLLKSQKLI
ncbi:SDR family NAD(P)-dependent oxidoreductase [Bacillus vallismortis]|uniref:SDR family NAD(P)-dependent oxidoreductase n=1 Tax=Bacillus vallismortis TaxID=72361 RepID=UPI000EF4DA59|nr:SDR family NAD(P)-dependent oxidoreductase [Bacillus vallismortis]MCY7918164.1 SDR family NAD(P)-dependent oxidoreductase [Bacillus vallismortis]MCY8423940.1 SDR family NAD(P)-dependent oxidoreductase [Bacillus vallismortis]